MAVVKSKANGLDAGKEDIEAVYKLLDIDSDEVTGKPLDPAPTGDKDAAGLILFSFCLLSMKYYVNYDL